MIALSTRPFHAVEAPPIAAQTNRSSSPDSDAVGKLGQRSVLQTVCATVIAMARDIVDRLATAACSVGRFIKSTFNAVSSKVSGYCDAFSHEKKSTSKTFGPTSTHALRASQDISMRLLSLAHDPAATAGLFRVSGAAGDVQAARSALGRGERLDCSALSTKTSASLLKGMLTDVLNVSAQDLRRAAKETLNLPVQCSIGDISRALGALDVADRAPFEAALVAQIHTNLEQSLYGDQLRCDIVKNTMMNLGALFNAAPSDDTRTFSKGSMALSFNLLKHPGTNDKAQTIEAYALSSRIIWDAIAGQSSLEVTHL